MQRYTIAIHCCYIFCFIAKVLSFTECKYKLHSSLVFTYFISINCGKVYPRIEAYD
jgi:hypothetical protein